MALTVGRLYRRMRTVDGGLSHGLLSALATTITHGPLRLAELADRELISAPSATRLIAELETQGYVRRRVDPADGRAFLVEGTETGLETIQLARSARASIMAELLDSLDPADAAVVAAALPALERMAATAWS
jgi:DNA-binding MarR family transcriptional regulator